jgi:hypothetical protein
MWVLIGQRTVVTLTEPKRHSLIVVFTPAITLPVLILLNYTNKKSLSACLHVPRLAPNSLTICYRHNCNAYQLQASTPVVSNSGARRPEPLERATLPPHPPPNRVAPRLPRPTQITRNHDLLSQRDVLFAERNAANSLNSPRCVYKFRWRRRGQRPVRR